LQLFAAWRCRLGRSTRHWVDLVILFYKVVSDVGPRVHKYQSGLGCGSQVKDYRDLMRGGIALEELEHFVPDRSEHDFGTLLQICLIVFALALEVLLQGLKSVDFLLIDLRIHIG